MARSNQYFHAPLLLKLLQYRSPKTVINQGFVLPMTLGLGLIMTIVGLTMIARSSDNKKIAVIDQDTAQSLSITEVGITRIQELFLRVPGLAKKDQSEWEDYANNVVDPVSDQCDDELDDLVQDIKDIANGWVNLGNKGLFRIKSYTYDNVNQIGNLNIDGTTETVVANVTTSSKAISSVNINIPVNSGTSGIENVGLWVKQFDDGSNESIGETNQKVDANVLSQTCDVESDEFDSSKNFPSGTNWSAKANPLQKFPDLPPLPSDVIDLTSSGGFETSSNSNTNSEDNMIGNLIANTQSNLTQKMSNLIASNQSNLIGSVIANNQTNLIGNFIASGSNNLMGSLIAQSQGNGPDKDEDKGKGKGKGKSGLELPRQEDIDNSPSGKTDFSYLVPSLGLTGNQEIDVKDGYTVKIFVQGNIELRGNPGIDTKPNSLQIYGSDGSSKYDGSSPSTNTGTQEVRLRGNANINAFIFAPNATAGVKGGGGSGGFYGAMWVNNWAGPPFGSSSNKIVIDPPNNMDWSLLPTEITNADLPGQSIAPSTLWQRQKATK
ncbi:MAG: hypothetical protein RI580_05970 [Halothece sp. Uz-M2-17]|nr:hypothetical protein [Halothece sp. Uz-M2-17]